MTQGTRAQLAPGSSRHVILFSIFQRELARNWSSPALAVRGLLGVLDLVAEPPSQADKHTHQGHKRPSARHLITTRIISQHKKKSPDPFLCSGGSSQPTGTHQRCLAPVSLPDFSVEFILARPWTSLPFPSVDRRSLVDFLSPRTHSERTFSCFLCPFW